MHHDGLNQYRLALRDNPPAFVDHVNDPWQMVPDLPEYNDRAYQRIVRSLEAIERERAAGTEPQSRCILILGEAGSGKTHLLMRAAQRLATSNHILFVRKPTNEESVAQHIWQNIVSSLTRVLPQASGGRSQMDDLLAHVFSDVLVPEFEQDIAEKPEKAELKKQWVRLLKTDPFNLFNMIGQGEKRLNNLRLLRNRTLRYLKARHPNVDETVADILIKYCFVSREDHKRILLTWLSGQQVSETEAKALGLPPAWVPDQDGVSDQSLSQQREEHALRAIQSIGVLSTHYHPLILAFDQLEGLRNERRLTERWSDAVREIITMAPNFLIITCVFPSLWQSWFLDVLNNSHNASAAERIAAQTVTLEAFGARHAARMVTKQMEAVAGQLRLPTEIYPFTDADVASLCQSVSSPRLFIQAARNAFEDWLDGCDEIEESTFQLEVTFADVDQLVAEQVVRYEDDERKTFDKGIPIEQDLVGRVRNLIKAILASHQLSPTYSRLTLASKVMPENAVVSVPGVEPPLFVVVLNSDGNAFTARIRNLMESLKGQGGCRSAIILRDQRCKSPGAAGREWLDTFQAQGGAYLELDQIEWTKFNALYDTLVAVEQHDLTIGSHIIDQVEFLDSLRRNGLFHKAAVLRHAASRAPFLAHAISSPGVPTSSQPAPALATPVDSVLQAPTPAPTAPPPETVVGRVLPPVSSMPMNGPAHAPEPSPEKSAATAVLSAEAAPYEVLIGSTDLEAPQYGVLGRFPDQDRKLAITLTKPLCLAILGYMGSGKSYSLGVLIENALLRVPGLIKQPKPMSVVAFNYRKNPDARFEYGGFVRPNDKEPEITRLRKEYGAAPLGIDSVRVLAFEQELNRRPGDYQGLKCWPICFKPEELTSEHWMILMKPPTPEAEYMDIIRRIIQKLYDEKRLSYKNLEKQVLTDERFSPAQRRRAQNRLSFASDYLNDHRPFEWADVFVSGTLTVVDLRMQALSESDALKLCLIMTDLVRRTKNGVNKMVVFDEAHEYVDCKELVKELENAITQIRHDGLSFVLASQFPERIPESLFKYLLTRLVFKLASGKSINTLKKAAPNLQALSPNMVSNLKLERGLCLIQSDDEVSDSVLQVPQLLQVRPRCTRHGGETVRNL
jgi:hypothetical protein